MSGLWIKHYRAKQKIRIDFSATICLLRIQINIVINFMIRTIA